MARFGHKSECDLHVVIIRVLWPLFDISCMRLKSRYVSHSTTRFFHSKWVAWWMKFISLRYSTLSVWSKPFVLSLYKFKADHFYILIRLYKNFDLIRSQTIQHIFKPLCLLQKIFSFCKFQTCDLLCESHVTLLLD